MRGLAIAVVALAACGTGQTRVVQYAPPVPPAFRPEPVVKVLEVSEPWRQDALASVDASMVPPVPEKVYTPEDLVSEANLSAVVKADSAETEGRMFSFRYNQGSAYRIDSCYGKWLTVALAVGEDVVRKPIFDDARPWDMDTAVSGDGHGNMVTMLFFRATRQRPTEPATILLHTNIGEYRLDVRVLPKGEKTCMSYVHWVYPERELAMLKRQQDEEDEPETYKPEHRQPADFDDRFACEVREGSPRWTPTSVTSFHGKTYIRFPNTVQDREIPNVSADGVVASKFYDRHNSELVLDGLPNSVLLQLGDKERGYEKVKCGRLVR